MALVYILFFVGFITLIKGADLLVDGASTLARKIGVSSLVIGLTVVAFGTSAPELAVNILASLEGNTDIAIGNILGSNIVNILLILGFSAVLYPLSVQNGTIKKEIPFAVFSVIVLVLLVGEVIFFGADSAILSRLDGFVLISFFVLFLFYIYNLAKSDKKQKNLTAQAPEVDHVSITRSLVMIILGLAGLVIGGKWIVDGAVAFAQSFGVSEALIGLTIVAIGTSLPEMATSIVAAYKKNVDIAVGGIIGSNIFNIFWILGISSIIQPLPFSAALATDLRITFVVTLILFLSLFVGRKAVLERWQGALLVLMYIIYVISLIYRG